MVSALCPFRMRKRLSLVVNNARFCLLESTPNLATLVLGLTLGRLSRDWERKYGHPVLVVETFVDPDQFSGGCYRAGGWKEMGQTSGFGRCRRDYYVKHDKPKRLFVRELVRGACCSLQAEHLKSTLASVEQKMAVVPELGALQLRSLIGYFKDIPDFRGRVGRYPLWSLLGIVACAHLSGAPRGQKDLAAFRTQNAAWVLGMFRRLSISVYAEWKLRNPEKTKHKTYTDLLAGVLRASLMLCYAAVLIAENLIQ